MKFKYELLAALSDGRAHESEQLEFKENWHQDCGKSLSAMANTRGGWLCVGIDDKGQVLKLATSQLKDIQAKAERHINQYLRPSAAVQSISYECIGDRNFLLIEVINPKSVTEWNQKYYKRTGSSTTMMQGHEKKQLELKWPGLDFSSFEYTGSIDAALVLDFAKFLNKGNGDWTTLEASKILSKLEIANKMTAGILFGDFSFRLIRYDHNGDLKDQREYQGLYRLLQDDFIVNIQSWSRTQAAKLKNGSLVLQEQVPYANEAVREALVNAVAHAAFEQQPQGGVRIEIYPQRLVISNRCSQESAAFIHKLFSRDSYIYNPLLMKTLRMVNFSEEVGTGKNKIFRFSIENLNPEPLFEFYRQPDGYGRWSVTLINKKIDPKVLKELDALKLQYGQPTDEYKVAAALVLWQGQQIKNIIHHFSEHYKKIILEILDDDNSPFFIRLRGDSIYVVVRPKGSVKLASGSEHDWKEVFRNFACKHSLERRITNQQARKILGLDDSRSSQVQVARLFQKLEKTGFMMHDKQAGTWTVAQAFSPEHASFIEYVKSLDVFTDASM